MPRLLAVSLFAAAAAIPAAAAAYPLFVAGTVVPGVPSAETEIRSVLGFFDRARAQHDAGVLDRILAPEFEAVTSAGARLGRSAFLRSGAPERGARMIEREELVVQVEGSRATATSRLIRIGTRRGPETADFARETLLLRRTGERWLIVSAAAAPDAPVSARAERLKRR